MPEYTLDLQLHGKFAGGVSKNMEIPVIAGQSQLKGLDIVVTGDILHKQWFEHVKQNITEESNGVYSDQGGKINFIIGGEVEDKNKVHHLFYLPSLESAQELREKLAKFGNLDCIMCGRPYIRLSPEEIAQKISEAGGIFGPAHSFTPYTGIYAHYDSLKNAYGEMHRELLFIELGLSADTDLADTISDNHKYSFLTSSDAHSPWPHRMGREFARMKMQKPDFHSLKCAFAEREEKSITLNAGLNPKEGKYHCTACNNCFAKYSIRDAEHLKWKCAKCKYDIKRGVRERIEMLSDTERGIHPKFRPPYMHMLPLAEIIQSALKSKGVETKKVQSRWISLIEKLGNEISILVDAPEEELLRADAEIGEKIIAFRKGLVHYIPGGGGNYGKPIICNSEKDFARIKEEMKYELACPDGRGPQKSLEDFK